MVELEKEVFTVECKSQNIFGPHCMQGFPFQTAFVLLTTSFADFNRNANTFFFFSNTQCAFFWQSFDALPPGHVCDTCMWRQGGHDTYISSGSR